MPGSLRLACASVLTPELKSIKTFSADSGFAGVGRYRTGSKPKSPEVIMLREAELTSGDEWRRRESNLRNNSYASMTLKGVAIYPGTPEARAR